MKCVFFYIYLFSVSGRSHTVVNMSQNRWKQTAKYSFLISVSQDEFPVPDEFPVVDEFPSVLKWRRKPSVVSVSSSLPDLLGTSTSGLSTTDTPFKSEQPLEGDKMSCTLTMQCRYIHPRTYSKCHKDKQLEDNKIMCYYY